MRTLLCWISFAHVILVQTEDRLPPHIPSHGRPDLIFRPDDTVELECIAEGSPTPGYNWTKNGLSLDMAKPNIRRLAHGTIVIDNAGSLDQGSYQCHAFNKYGATMSVTYAIRMAFLTPASGVNVTTVEGVAGESLKLTANHLPCFPVGNFDWEIAQRKLDMSPMPLIQSRRIQVDDLGNLLFANLDVSDGSHGLYRSAINNNYLDIKTSSSYFNLTVKQAPAGPKQHKPEVLFSTANAVVALEKRHVELRCFFSGNPDPMIYWTRYQLNKTRFKFSDFNTRFTILNVHPEDAGGYVCQGSNTVGLANYTMQIIVEAAPEFRSPTDGPYNQNVTVGEDFKINCNAYAKPEARIDWFINTVKLDIDKLPPRFSISSDTKSLTVSRVQMSDLMVIQCNASNKHGYAFGAGYLNVIPAPEFRSPTDGPYNQNVTVGEDFKVNCNAYAKPEARIEWFINTVKLDIDKLPPRFSISSDIKSLTVSRVQLSDLMVIQCNASNKHGYAFGAGYLNVIPSSGSFRIPQSWLSLMVLMISIEMLRHRCFE